MASALLRCDSTVAKAALIMRPMLRSDQYLYPQCTPPQPLLAATLLLLRDRAPGGWEVLISRRSERASFAPGMYVFPGGGIEAQDAAAGHDVVQFRADMDETMRTAAVAALRETLEEMGVLLAVNAQGAAVDPAAVQGLDRRTALWPQLAAQGLKLDAAALWQVGHFTAPPHLPKRFAVPFFVARMPHGQTPEPDNSEQFEAVWVEPQQALAAHKARQMPMMLPTVRTLTYLAQFPSVDAIFAAVAQGPLWKFAPRFALENGKERSLLDSDAAYGEAAMVSPDGQVVHELAWQTERAVPLRKNVLRLTAPNANVMTGPGTNSYLVGEPATGYIAIDPGPADAGHVARLLDAAGGDVRHIVCTHSHADHSPGAFLLQALCCAARFAQAADLRPAFGPHGAGQQPLCAGCGASRWRATDACCTSARGRKHCECDAHLARHIHAGACGQPPVPAAARRCAAVQWRPHLERQHPHHRHARRQYARLH